jgi:hypothetical protein
MAIRRAHAALLIGVLLLADAFHPRAAQSAGGHSYALLVGVSQYPRLGQKYTLQGPVNDTALMRSVLEAPPFSMAAADIFTLAGWPADPARRPTRANIERAFAHLTETARPGDQVFIMMGGHGSQQPADDDPNDPEPDGLDELFLPADTARWNGQIGRVENAIVDDDVRRWVTGLRKSGAFVWIVFDSCQSGSMVRGAPASFERERQIPAEELVPRDVLDRARRRAAEQTRGSMTKTGGAFGLSDDNGQLAALYAAQSNETTPERPLPETNSQVHGLFTYTLADVLAHSSTPLTYRELAERVLARYRSLGRPGPTPTFEGGGLDRLVLGQQAYPDRPRLLLGRRSEAGWELHGGSIHGLTRGSILELFPPAGSDGADKPIGYARVADAGAASALVTPFAYEGRPEPRPEQMVDGTRARIALYDPGDDRLRLALEATPARSGTGPTVLRTGAGPPPLERAIGALPARTLGLAVRTDRAEEADWFVRVVGDEVALIPASGWMGTKPGAAAEVPQAFRVGRLGEEALSETLGAAVQRIARARNLMRLTQGPPAERSLGLGLRLEAVRYDSADSSEGRLVRYGASGPLLTSGEHVQFRITNTGTRSLDVTLLFLGSDYGIQTVFPNKDQDLDNRIGPGEAASTGRYRVDDNTLGNEQVVAIGVAVNGPRVNFALLEQPGLDALTTRGGVETPLMRLLERTLYGRAPAAGALRAVSVDQPHIFQMLAWQTVTPAARLTHNVNTTPNQAPPKSFMF